MKSKVSSLLLLIGSFILHFIGLGVSQSFGILYSALLEVFDSGNTKTSWIASLNSALFLGSGSIGGVLIRYYGFKKVALLGSVVASVGMATSMFVPSIYFLYLTYGVITGIGMGILYLASDVIVTIAFDKRRSLAVAVVSIGGSVGTLVMPLFTTICLELYDWRGTFLILSGIMLQGVVAGLLLNVKSIEDQYSTKDVQRKQLGTILKHIFCTNGFILFTTSGGLVALVYFIPYVMFPDFIKKKGFSIEESALVMTISGITGIIGRIMIGFIADFRCVNRFILNGVILMIGGCSSVLVVLVDQQLVWYMSYGAVLGIFTGTFAFLQTLLTADLIGEDNLSVAFGMVLLFHGICSLVGPPIVGLISDIYGRYDEAFIFAGCIFFLGGFTSCFTPLHRGLGSSGNYNFKPQHSQQQ